MNFRTLALATTALTMSVSAAWADNNESYLGQTANGGGNTALIIQDGTGNIAGRSTNDITQRSDAGSDGNVLTIFQTGDSNSVGNTNEGFLQEGRNGPANTASITQNYDGNTVGTVQQRASGPSTAATGNTLTVLQGDIADEAGGNRIAKIVQRRLGENGNSADISMTGADNFIDRVEQFSNLAGNTITASITGMNNGPRRFGNSVFTGFAAETGARAHSLKQGAFSGSTDGGNKINLLITGNENGFGVQQLGIDNDVLTLEINGDRNELGVFQMGTNNVADVKAIAVGSDDNNVGVRQELTNNLATVTIVSGSGNEFATFQNGDNNNVTATITGNTNGSDSVASMFEGDAADAVFGLTEFEVGKLKQIGDNNIIVANITGDSDTFGALQTGNANDIQATVNGSFNVSAVAQVGSGNISNYSQTGNGNNAGFSQ